MTVIDGRNYNLFQPLLYQVATAALSPADIAAPIRSLLRDHANTRVLLEEVVSVDRAARKVHTRSGADLDYDTDGMVVKVNSLDQQQRPQDGRHDARRGLGRDRSSSLGGLLEAVELAGANIT